MGIFSKIFGADNSSTSTPDGSWLSGERDGAWTEVGRMGRTQSIELNEDSCFLHNIGTMFILRSFRPDTKGMIYMGCVAYEDDIDVIHILVDRVERPNGTASQRDIWTIEKGIVESTVSNVEEIINMATNLANFNGYTSPPHYALIMIRKFIEMNEARKKNR